MGVGQGQVQHVEYLLLLLVVVIVDTFKSLAQGGLLIGLCLCDDAGQFSDLSHFPVAFQPARLPAENLILLAVYVYIFRDGGQFFMLARNDYMFELLELALKLLQVVGARSLTDRIEPLSLRLRLSGGMRDADLRGVFE